MSDDELRTLRDLLAKMSPLPWAASDWREDDGPLPVTIDCAGEPSSIWPGGISRRMIASAKDTSFSDDQAIVNAAAIVACMNAMPTLLDRIEAGRWVPCAERLPDTKGDYLVCIVPNDEPWMKVAGFDPKRPDRWEVDDADFAVRWTHWRALPAPPKEMP